MYRAILTIVVSTAVLAACSLPSMPRVHKIRVQQGNVITQEMIDRLKPGMTRSQVAFIMGEPVLKNTFNSKRWDYLYTVELPGYFNSETRVSLYFENDVLAYFTGDIAPTSAISEAGEGTEEVAETTEGPRDETGGD